MACDISSRNIEVLHPVKHDLRGAATSRQDSQYEGIIHIFHGGVLLGDMEEYVRICLHKEEIKKYIEL